MKPEKFVEITQLLVPQIDSSLEYPNEFIVRVKNNFIFINKPIVEVSEIHFISTNCSYKSFSVGYFYFIETKELFDFIAFGQLESSYILFSKIDKKIYLIGYETVDEYLYGDGEIPSFEEKIPVANSYSDFLDALTIRLELQKKVIEKQLSFKDTIRVKPFIEQAIISAGGNGFKFEMFF